MTKENSFYAASEAGFSSWATESVLDTRSEPPRCSGRVLEKLQRRGSDEFLPPPNVSNSIHAEPSDNDHDASIAGPQDPRSHGEPPLRFPTDPEPSVCSETIDSRYDSRSLMSRSIDPEPSVCSQSMASKSLRRSKKSFKSGSNQSVSSSVGIGASGKSTKSSKSTKTSRTTKSSKSKSSKTSQAISGSDSVSGASEVSGCSDYTGISGYSGVSYTSKTSRRSRSSRSAYYYDPSAKRTEASRSGRSQHSAHQETTYCSLPTGGSGFSRGGAGVSVNRGVQTITSHGQGNNNSRLSRDPDGSTVDDRNHTSNHNSLALVPANQNPATMDPPTSCSTSGSSSSTDGSERSPAGYAFDPPSSVCSASLKRDKKEQLAIYGDDSDDETSGVSKVSGMSKVVRGNSSAVVRGAVREVEEDSFLDASEDGGEYAEEKQTLLDTIESASESESDYSEQSRSRRSSSNNGSRSSSRRSSSQSGSRSSNSEEEPAGSMANELVVRNPNAVDSYPNEENALALREDSGGELVVADPSPNALVKFEDTHPEDAIVEAQPHYLSAAVDNNFAMVPMNSDVFEAYDHTFVTCPEHNRFRFLYTFLKKNLDKKIMIFFSTTNSVKFHSKMLGHFHIPCLIMHSRQKREQFISTFFKYSDLDEGILCATDAAGRDLDIPPSVDWVIQFEPPDDPSEYILRVARISCDSDRVGRSLLFLNPGEHGFLKYYNSAGIPVSEFEVPERLADIQANIEYHVNESERLLKYAKEAYGSYLIAYASHGFRDVYNVHDLNKNDVASAFGLTSIPGDEEEDSVEGKKRDDDDDSYRESSKPKTKTWTSTKKKEAKTWRTVIGAEQSWPHAQIKLHPKFRSGYKPPPPEDDEEEF